MRGNFPFFKSSKLIYLDNAATTHKPQVVIDALTRFYETENASVHRGIYDLAEAATTQYESARSTIARYLNALPSEIVFTRNTTEGINLLATSWARHVLQPGDEIVLTELEHHSNIVPWMQIAHEKGAIIRWIPVRQDATLNMEQVDAYITHKTRLVALTYSSNVVGPLDLSTLQAIIAAAHGVGARVCVDAAQAMAHRRIDVQALACDFLVFSGHKMFGPLGIGVVYIRQSEHDRLVPYQTGGGMMYQVASEEVTWRSMPHMLEAGTPHIAGAVGLEAAVNYLGGFDFATVEQHEAALMRRLLEGLMNLPSVLILGSPETLKKGSLASIYIPTVHPHDVAAYLSTRGIAIRAGNHCCQPLHQKLGIPSSVRISCALYNTLEEIDATIECLKRVTAV